MFLKQKTRNKRFGFMWYLQESNQGHTDFQSVALPTELRYLLKAGANINVIYFLQNIKLKNIPIIFQFNTVLTSLCCFIVYFYAFRK